MNILVIALTIKGAIAFESKSDPLRQVLRHRDQLDSRVLDALPGSLQQRLLEKELKLETIRLPAEKVEDKKTGLFFKLELAFEQALKWMAANKDKEVDTISIVGVTRSEKGTPILRDKTFLPATLVIFYKDDSGNAN